LNYRIAAPKAGVCLATFAIVLVLSTGRLPAQDRIKELPGYDRYQEISKQIPKSAKLGNLSVTWKDEGKAFEYTKDGKSFRYDIDAKKATEAPATKGDATKAVGKGMGRRGGGGVERGRQLASSLSPDGKLKAFHRDRNLWLSDPDGAIEAAITTDGDAKTRIKYGTASWVYGEELYQTTAIWWAPDGKKVAFYRFDEAKVPDYYLALAQNDVQDKLDVEPYPKAGAPNPIADILIYDLKTKKTTKVDLRDGQPFTDGVVGHYAYGVAWSKDGKELLFNRTNRRQNIMEFIAADPETGKCRTIVREEWLPSWVDNSPTIRYLEDGKRFILESERTGWKNYYLYDLSGKLLATLTDHDFEVGNIVRIDEKAGVLDYMARSGDNAMKLQLHRVGLDGKGDKRLTDPTLNHTVDVAPDGKHFIDVAQTHDVPPVTRLVDADGKVIEELNKSDLTAYDKLGLKRVELITFKASDGKTLLHGMLHKPSNFDPKKKYPVLVSVYGGPATNAARETFALPSPLTEYGFLIASFDSRSAAGRGKRFLDAIYLKLGQVEIDDQAEGVKSLWDRPYVDKMRVGIHGTSYGGFASAACLLRHPDVFQAACASSPVTDWKNYDTIYTERYMWTPQENKAGYDGGSTLPIADKLKGRLMLFFGTADNNVHPSNSLQLIAALQKAGKSFDVQIGPDMGHSGIRPDRMMEFFIENLVLPGPGSKSQTQVRN
jgi:dipeptidyl-peptidase-4